MKKLSSKLSAFTKDFKIKRYFFYALGEILLIVVGVLIAVNINNFNDNKKQEKHLELMLQNISNDLKTDITNLDQHISEYEELDSIINSILDNKYASSYYDTIKKTNYFDCTPCFAYHIGFITFSPKLDGYNQLSNLNLSHTLVDKSLSADILLFYKENLKDNKIIEESLVNIVLKNLESIEQYDWYADYMRSRYNEKSIEYFKENKIYRNKLVSFKTLALENHLYLLKNYRSSAIKLSQRLNDYKLFD